MSNPLMSNPDASLLLFSVSAVADDSRLEKYKRNARCRHFPDNLRVKGEVVMGNQVAKPGGSRAARFRYGGAHLIRQLLDCLADYLEVEENRVECRFLLRKGRERLPGDQGSIFSALSTRSSRYSSQLRDTNEILLHMSPCARFKPFARDQIDPPSQNLLEVIVESEVTSDCRWAVEVDEHVDVAFWPQLISCCRTEQ